MNGIKKFRDIARFYEFPKLAAVVEKMIQRKPISIHQGTIFFHLVGICHNAGTRENLKHPHTHTHTGIFLDSCGKKQRFETQRLPAFARLGTTPGE